MVEKIIYDIRNKDNARDTLTRLTGIRPQIWERNIHREQEFDYTEDFVDAMMCEHGTVSLPERYENLVFIYSHVTTSAYRCESILKHGLFDLCGAYLCKDSELRRFLDAHGVFIDIDNAILDYRGHKFDISYGACPMWHESLEYKCWLVGRKFYHDFTTCGFLSVVEDNPYGGWVHRRPEILSDIDKLLRTRLSYEWMKTHRPYEIVARVSGFDVLYPGDDEDLDEEKVKSYVYKAYSSAFSGSLERELLMKNGVRIPPGDILEIKPLVFWKKKTN